jgi:hypothetical protein
MLEMRGRQMVRCGTLLVLGLMLVAVSACLDGPRDSAGRVMTLSEWKTVEPHELRLNTPLLLHHEISEVKTQIRGNSVYHSKIIFDNGRGYVTTQMIPIGLYSLRATNKLRSEEYFKSGVKEFIKKDEVVYEELMELSHQSKKSSGFCAIVTVPSQGRRCLYARSGYKMNVARYDNDEGQFDTVLIVGYCDPNVRCGDFSDLFSGLDVVKDRVAFRAAIQALKATRPAKPAAAVGHTEKSGCHDVGKNVAYVIAEGETCLDGDVTISTAEARKIQAARFKPASVDSKTAVTGSGDDIENRLLALRKLLDKGLIQPEEYHEKRKAILKNL